MTLPSSRRTTTQPKMKYARGTVLRWTPKALLSVTDADADDRLIFLDASTALLYRRTQVVATGLKTHDSHVRVHRLRGAPVDVLPNLTYVRSTDAAPLPDDLYEDVLREFGIREVSLAHREIDTSASRSPDVTSYVRYNLGYLTKSGVRGDWDLGEYETREAALASTTLEQMRRQVPDVARRVLITLSVVEESLLS